MSDLHPAEAAYFNAIRPGTNWSSKADAAVAELAASGRPFTADDVRRLVGEEPHHPNAWGGLFKYWGSRGLRRLGYTQSAQSGRRGSAIAVWQGAQQLHTAA